LDKNIDEWHPLEDLEVVREGRDQSVGYFYAIANMLLEDVQELHHNLLVLIVLSAYFLNGQVELIR
jgi:hypothetical protein